ncbi:hypothetical protein SAMN04488515_0520 [Cognatiyoonia koreensis]|uniref:DUF3592 domain-containing protein n=1 Tax=Cognatiyoonia koreensis TaxID=364200 RepID=A0A1I0NBK9_9RHOB|nr:hypothetical protein [Cognatiyoonia koreensis]SEV98536.1 hypothetical protein SAMN04488515_0520 [Cognatiyoonia koreensis]
MLLAGGGAIIAIGLVSALIFDRPTQILPLGFGLVGLGLLLQNYLRGRYWVPCDATVEEYESGDPPTLRLMYTYKGLRYNAVINETTMKSEGSKYPLMIDPDDPSRYASDSWEGPFIGLVFFLSGTAIFVSSQIF